MPLDHNDFLQLSRIAESLRRSDPELARKLAAPMRRRSLSTVLCYVTLSVLALLTLAGLAIGDTTGPSSTIAKTALHRDETTAADPRPRGRSLVDGQTAGRHAPPMLSPADYGASGTP
ncbi:MAG: hypothetical protein V7646_7713 [Pseudonocardia sp.]|jgi:hypothetical protein